ncbi:ATP-binding protein [Larsenimonas suaedae]|uniref:histidine kinase n=1 Tax=Larsenimonas suaedae TaxID=1851019 RepID=A0ABU1GY68_9GAMM|nr:ATP-binding protein [Larsenimonas suaedae]MCM2973385.1 ATP-binding protein [Larsenimonas suaedae]MDR5896278.1 ATP-binding protein [Larsenimonas suaedae]
MSFIRISRSLRLRLMLSLSLVAVVIMGLTWVLHGMLLQSTAREFLAGRLAQEAQHLLAEAERGARPVDRSGGTAGPGLDAFHHVYLVRRGEQVVASTPAARTPLAPYLDGPARQTIDLTWQGRHLLAWRERGEVDGQPVTVLVAEDFAQVEHGLARLHRWVGVIAVLVSVVLLGLSLLAVQRSLRPLDALARQLAALRRGEREALSLKTVSELDGVVGQLNEFVEEQRYRQARSRELLANLSHGLKTPLAAIIQALQSSKPLSDTRRSQILHRLHAIDEQLTNELKRSRIAGQATGQRRLCTEDLEAMQALLATLYPAIELRFEPEISALTHLPLERQDAMELLGIVLDNAAKWARTRVVVSSDRPECVIIDDDGPGVPAYQRALLGTRGTRLDEQRPGHGLGLSILRQMVERYRGEVRFDASPLGGLRVTLHLLLE